MYQIAARLLIPAAVLFLLFQADTVQSQDPKPRPLVLGQAKPDPTGETKKPQLSLGLGDGFAKPASVFDQLVREIDNMIPGDLDKNPDRKKLVEDAIKAFQDRNAEKTMEIFNQMTASDPYLPPTDLLLASLSFIVSDQSTGKILLERAAAKHPRNLGVSSAFSRLAINQGRIADGSVHLEKLESMLGDPKVSGEVREFYTKQYLDGMIDVAMSQKRFPEARALLDHQRKNLPDSPKVQLVSAELEFWEKDIDKSLEYLNALKSKNPKARAPESVLATWYRRTGDLANSQKWLEAGAAKYPNDPQVQLEYGSWAIRQENFELATASIEKAVKNSKETEFSRNLKGKIAFAKGAYLDAASHFEAIAASNPGNIDAMNMLALSFIESGDENKRKKSLELALNNFRRAPDNLVTRSALGYIQLRMGNLDQAKVALAVGANAKRGASPEIDFFVASVLKAMKQKEKARSVLEIALRYKGFFLYRSPAKKMLNDLGGPLPAPKTDAPTK